MGRLVAVQYALGGFDPLCQSEQSHTCRMIDVAKGASASLGDPRQADGYDAFGNPRALSGRLAT
jgi:hypothetical protein